MRVHVRTFGCRANAYDSEQTSAMLRRAGLDVVAEVADADVAIVNSCAVTADAEADLRQAVRRAARAQPGLRTIVTGCAAARSAATIAALPSVTDVIAGADLPALAAALDLGPGIVPPVATRQDGVRALLRVQDGCDEHCTFCATTLARGANRSRTADTLVAEATALAEHHAEIVLTGVHVGTWGRDLGGSLGQLLERLVRDVPRVRFRLASVEATEVDARLAELLRDATGRVCPYLHAPLQSGSDGVLRRMGRHWYDAASYREATFRLTDGRSVFGLGADVMSGFPGETDADHEATMALVRDLPFTHLHVFPFSPRPGTAAPRLRDAVAPAVARARAAELRALGEAKAAAYRAARAGTSADLVVMATAPSAMGLSEDYLRVPLRETGLRRGDRVIRRIGAAGESGP